MTLNRLRGYYLLLILVDQALWTSLFWTSALAEAVSPEAQFLAFILRLTLLILTCLPRRFRLPQVRALRYVSVWAFAEGACAAWSAHSGLMGEATFWLTAPSAAACHQAYILAAWCITALAANAIILPRTRWL